MARKDGVRGTTPRPTGDVRVTMYDVGFGDCFLVSFPYSNGRERHVLIDCGTSTERKDKMEKVVGQIAQDCGGKLHGLVVTHRHLDHLSAFGLKGVGDKLASLAPEIVVQPWTEHPRAEPEAETAPEVFPKLALTHLRALAAGQEFAAQIVRAAPAFLAGGSRSLHPLVFVASLAVKNRAAVDRLEGMGKKHAYVHAGVKSGLEQVLPGVRVSVLGPPTLKRSQAIRRQTEWDEDEFWKLQARLAARGAVNRPQLRARSAVFSRAATTALAKAPSHAKWLMGKLDRTHAQNVQRIVTALDNALNNTSVILLFEVGSKALLFPGDAQLEIWQYALQDADTKARLRKVDLYKVGHHGSTNATPHSLWNLFRNRKPKPRPGRLVTVLSTKPGKHERVPRKSLVNELGSNSDLHSTQDWARHKRLSETYVL